MVLLSRRFLLFPAQMFFKYLYEVENIGRAVWWPFFGSWILVLLWAWFAPCERKVAKQVGYLTALILLAIFPIDIAVSGTALFTTWTHGYLVSLGIDLSCFAGGLYLLKVIKKFELNKDSESNADITMDVVEEGA